LTTATRRRRRRPPDAGRLQDTVAGRVEGQELVERFVRLDFEPYFVEGEVGFGLRAFLYVQDVVFEFCGLEHERRRGCCGGSRFCEREPPEIREASLDAVGQDAATLQ
jgi:hypothetical protein